MRFYISFLTFILPVVLAAKEVPGEELPANDMSLLLKDDYHLSDEAAFDGENQVVKRSISDIAARRRSALDKSFMRFGRSDPSLERIKLSGGNLMRFGRSDSQNSLRQNRAAISRDFMRFGRSAGNMMRFGRASNLMRFGRGGNNMMRFGRGGNNMMRFGRGGNNMMRFGRGGNNMMRFGRGGNNMMRFGRAGNLMRFGRSDNDFLNYENDIDFDVEDDTDADSELTPTLTPETYTRIARSSDKDRRIEQLNPALFKGIYDDNQDDSMENREQYITGIFNNDNDKSDKSLNGKGYTDENFLVRDSTDNPDDVRDSLALIFADESRRKRSLLKIDPNKKQGPQNIVPSSEQPEVSSVRHSRPDSLENCSS